LAAHPECPLYPNFEVYTTIKELTLKKIGKSQEKTFETV